MSMTIDFTPLDIDWLNKKYAAHSTQSKILFSLIAVLTVVVLGLLMYIFKMRSYL